MGIRRQAGRITVRVALPATIVTLLMAAAGQGSAVVSAQVPSFAPPAMPQELDADPEAVAVADVTGDGRRDVLVTTSLLSGRSTYDASLLLFEQRPDGSLGPARKLADTSLHSAPLAAGDLDSDGDTDVVIATRNAVLILWYGAGGLAAPVPLPDSPPGRPRDVEIADMDGDGRRDIVVSAQDDGIVPAEIAVLHNTGVGFERRQVAEGWMMELEIGDVSGDGRPDIVAWGWGGGARVFVWRQTGSGWSPADHITVGATPTDSVNAVEAADVTGDGRTDVVVAGGGNVPGSYVRVLQQRTDGSLAAPVRYPSADIPEAVEAADLNGDGLRDVVVLHTGSLVLGIYLQQADGTLTPEGTRYAPTAYHDSSGLALSDLSGDGRIDIVAADWGYGRAPMVLRQRDAAGPMEPPTTTLHSGPPSNTTSRNATFTFSSDEPAALFECFFDL
ncbi:MAG: FG-GAP repeat domain-containing protein, partial [Gaiellales bacterium]